MRGDHPIDSPLRLEEYWVWVAVALFLSLAVDLLTSLSAAATVGLEAERNPLMARLLGQHLAVVVAVHLAIASPPSACSPPCSIALEPCRGDSSRSFGWDSRRFWASSSRSGCSRSRTT